MNRLTRTGRAVRRAVLGRRRLLAAVLTATAVAAGLQAVAGPPPPTTPLLVAARDLPAGTVLRTGDLEELRFLPASVPLGTLGREELVGRTTAGPLRAGEVLTDVRVVRDSILAGYPGLVAAPVRITDAEAVRLLRVGDRIDLVAADPHGFDAAMVARDVPVLALPRSAAEGGGRLVVVAIPEESALSVAQAGVSSVISVVINR